MGSDPAVRVAVVAEPAGGTMSGNAWAPGAATPIGKAILKDTTQKKLKDSGKTNQEMMPRKLEIWREMSLMRLRIITIGSELLNKKQRRMEPILILENAKIKGIQPNLNLAKLLKKEGMLTGLDADSVG